MICYFSGISVLNKRVKQGQKNPQFFAISSGCFAIWFQLMSQKSTPDDPPYSRCLTSDILGPFCQTDLCIEWGNLPCPVLGPPLPSGYPLVGEISKGSQPLHLNSRCRSPVRQGVFPQSSFWTVRRSCSTSIGHIRWVRERWGDAGHPTAGWISK